MKNPAGAEVRSDTVLDVAGAKLSVGALSAQENQVTAVLELPIFTGTGGYLGDLEAVWKILHLVCEDLRQAIDEGVRDAG